MPVNPPLRPEDDPTNRPPADPSLGIPETPQAPMGGNRGYRERGDGGSTEILTMLRDIRDRVEKIEHHLDELVGQRGGKQGSQPRRAPGSVPSRSRSR